MGSSEFFSSFDFKITISSVDQQKRSCPRRQGKKNRKKILYTGKLF